MLFWLTTDLSYSSMNGLRYSLSGYSPARTPARPPAFWSAHLPRPHFACLLACPPARPPALALRLSFQPSPSQLVEAFRATLEEVQQADVLLVRAALIGVYPFT